MNKFFKRIGAILLALTLCFGTTLTAFAGYASQSGITNKGDVYLYVDSAKNNAEFSYSVEGNPTGLYDITITDPNHNVVYTDTIYGNTDNHKIYRKSVVGTYTFTFQCVTYTRPSVTATAGIN